MSISTTTTPGGRYSSHLSNHPYPLSKLSTSTFSLHRNGDQQDDFLINVYSISLTSLQKSYATKGSYLRQSADIILLRDDQQIVVAQYCHGYGPCSNMSTIYGHVIRNGGDGVSTQQSDNALERGFNMNFVGIIRKHFEANW